MGWIIFIGIVVLFFVAIIVYAFIIRKKMIRDNLEFEKELTDKGFSIEQKIEGGQSIFFIDKTMKRWCIKEADKKEVRIYNFSDMREFVLIDNDTKVVRGKAGEEIIGDVKFRSKSATLGDECKKMELQIRTNNVKSPTIMIKFIGIIKYKRSDETYATIASGAEEMVVAIGELLSKISPSDIPLKEEKEEIRKTMPGTRKTTGANTEAKIRSILKLKNDGVITEEEYNVKKAELLKLM